LKLKEIAEIRTGLVLSRKKADIHDEKYFTYSVVSLKAFSDIGKLMPEQHDDFVAQEILDDEYITQKGDVLVRLREPNLAVYIDDENTGLVVPSHVAIIRTMGSAIVEEYLAHHINSNSVQNQLSIVSKGTTIPMIKTKDLADLKIKLPPLEIQQRIVSWLGLANREIELLDALKTAKNQYKKEILDTIIQQGNEA